MLLVHGYIHGDPHPGNVLCRAHPSGNGKTQVVILDHGLYSELSESSRRAMSNLWLAIATGNASRAVGAAKELKVPDEFTWLLPLTLARKTTDGRPVNRELLEKKWAEDKAKGGVGRPGLTEASLIGQNLSKEMIIVLRANALVRNVIKALGAKDERAVTALEIRRQWSNVRYAALGVIIPNGLGESTLANVPYPTRLRWRLATIGVSTRTAFFALRRRLSTHRR
jgi:aarF domain-containing kinase